MRVLLDTNVVAELARERGEPRVRDALAAAPDDELFVSVLTVGEIRAGIEALEPSRKRRLLGLWLDELRSAYRDRILPVSAEIAEEWGRMSARRRRLGRPLAAVDGLIAATARVHDLVLATRNLRDFGDLDLDLWDPWSDPRPASAG